MLKETNPTIQLARGSEARILLSRLPANPKGLQVIRTSPGPAPVFDSAGSVVVITGAASGLGTAIVRHLAAASSITGA